MPKPESSNEQARVFVGNLARGVNFLRLKQMFGLYGVIRDTYMPLDSKNKQRNMGFAFIEFETPQEAHQACAALNETQGPGDLTLVVKIAEPRRAQ